MKVSIAYRKIGNSTKMKESLQGLVEVEITDELNGLDWACSRRQKRNLEALSQKLEQCSREDQI